MQMTAQVSPEGVPSTPSGLREPHFVAVAATIGVVLSMALSMLFWKWDRRRAEAEFSWQAKTQINAIGTVLEQNAETLYSLRHLFVSMKEVDPIGLREVVNELRTRRPGVSGFQWAPRVRGSDRFSFEASLRKLLGHDIQISDLTPDGQSLPAPSRVEYFPVAISEPRHWNEMECGRDLASIPGLGSLLAKARDGAGIVLSDPSLKFGPATNPPALIALLPVYRNGIEPETKDARGEMLRGFVVGVFRTKDILESAFDKSAGTDMEVLFLDQGASEEPQILHFHGVESNLVRPAVPTEAAFRKGFHLEFTLPVQDRKWVLLFRPAPAWWAKQTPLTSYGSLVGGLTITGLVAAYLRVANRRTMELEGLVRQRTSELLASHDRISCEISERRQAEAALRESAANLILVQRLGQIGSWEVDLNEKSLRWSAETFRIFGHEPKKFHPTTESFYASVHPEDVAIVRQAVEASLRTEYRYRVEHRIVRTDGSQRFVVEQAEIIRDSSGEPSRMIGTIQDVTDRKEIERKLQETQKLESLGVLAGGVAHDFNNLLTGILGNASLARLDVPPNSSLETYLGHIESASLRAAELCKQMLAYSGKGRFAIRNLSLSTLVEETTPLLRLSISKKAKLHFELTPNLPPVAADATQVSQIVMNLVINASEAIGDETGEIRIATGVMHPDRAYLDRAHLAFNLPEGEYVFLEVSDTGCGMSQETAAKIFDPFFTTKFTGRGLGLAAVLGIVRGHKGALKVVTEPGQGTQFRILLPRAGGPIETPAIPGAESSDWQGSGKILVVDDEEPVRTAAAGMLKSLGFETVLARDGREGLARIREHPDEFTAVLLDLTMPQLDGEETYRELRLERLRPRVILMSGFNEQEATVRFEGRGLAGFLQKPFSLGTLRETLRSTLA